MRFQLFLLLLFARLGLAQELPVEIELVPPTGGAFMELSAPQPPMEYRVVRPKRRPCRVCKEVVEPRSCRCYELLTEKMAKGLYRQVREHLASVTMGRIALKRPVDVRVVSRSQLSQMGGERLLGLYQDGIIWLSYDLNRRQALAVLAHEFGHAWFFQHRADVNTANDLLFEGFPEFVSYLVLQEEGDNEACYRISTTDQSIYGRGARRLLGVYRRSGLEPVIRLALSENGV